MSYRDNFFSSDDHLSIGQCPWWRVDEHERTGYPLPPFEPVDDDYAGSHQLVWTLRDNIETFDSIVGIETNKWEASINNLFLMADLATAAAAHMRRRLDAIEAEDQIWQEKWHNAA